MANIQAEMDGAPTPTGSSLLTGATDTGPGVAVFASDASVENKIDINFSEVFAYHSRLSPSQVSITDSAISVSANFGLFEVPFTLFLLIPLLLLFNPHNSVLLL